MLRNKKGIELSMNFIVVIILSIVIFGFGIQFISRLFTQGTDITKMSESELDEKIRNIVCEGSERVCIADESIRVGRKRIGYFGIKIFNILEGQNFDIAVSRPNPSGYRRDKSEIYSDNLVWFPQQRTVYIGANEERKIAVGIEVPSNATPGTYIFDVGIKSQEGSDYARTQKLYVEVFS